MLEIIEPQSPAELEAVRTLMRAFVDWARERYARERQFVERYFDPEAFAAELEQLPGKYARPRGRLLLAREQGEAIGCVALRDIGDGVCEMKRLYVAPGCHGKGVGQSLALALIAEAKSAGYRKMRLDTGPGQLEAQTLYRKLGFRVIGPYYAVPEELKTWLVFMELNLTGSPDTCLSV
jgi:ribosomal protein S18 acetylase RimI-like enzyme